MQKLFRFYKEHQADFVKKYLGKTIVIKDYEVVAVYVDEWEAARYASEMYEPGSFIVQQVTPGTGAYTVYIMSNYVIMDTS
jgi:hypothetical protein